MRAAARTSCTRTPGTPTWPATGPSSSTTSRTSSPRTAWSRSGPGRPSSSAAATGSARGPSGPPTRPPTRWWRSARACAPTSCRRTPRWTSRGCTSSTTASTPSSTAPTRTPRCSSGIGVDPSRPYVAFVGRITRQKGVPHLLRAGLAFDRDLQIVLLAGAADTPELKAETDGLIAELRAHRDGVFVVSEMLPREEVRQVLTGALAFLCPSVYEPLGIVNLEAMACETAVVSSNVGGIPEVVLDGETGIVVPYDVEDAAGFEAASPRASTGSPPTRTWPRGSAAPAASVRSPRSPGTRSPSRPSTSTRRSGSGARPLVWTGPSARSGWSAAIVRKPDAYTRDSTVGRPSPACRYPSVIVRLCTVAGGTATAVVPSGGRPGGTAGSGRGPQGGGEPGTEGNSFVRVAVTGATGVIGAAVVPELVARRPRGGRPGPHPGEGRASSRASARPLRRPACSTTPAWSRCSTAPTRSATSPPTSRSG